MEADISGIVEETSEPGENHKPSLSKQILSHTRICSCERGPVIPKPTTSTSCHKGPPIINNTIITEIIHLVVQYLILGKVVC